MFTDFKTDSPEISDILLTGGKIRNSNEANFLLKNVPPFSDEFKNYRYNLGEDSGRIEAVSFLSHKCCERPSAHKSVARIRQKPDAQNGWPANISLESDFLFFGK